MKPKERKPEVVYRIIDRATGEAVGSYSRAYCDEYDFGSVAEARSANCHDAFKDNEKYAVAQYRVTYELIDPDVPGHTKEFRRPTLLEEIQTQVIDNALREAFIPESVTSADYNRISGRLYFARSCEGIPLAYSAPNEEFWRDFMRHEANFNPEPVDPYEALERKRIG